MKQLIQDNSQLLNNESLLSTANGYIGVRANYEEGYPEGFKTIRGTYINGFYDNHEITYGESAYGFPKEAQQMLNVIDGQGIEIYFDDERFSVFQGELLSYNHALNIEAGYAERSMIWRSNKHKTYKITIRRMTSFECLELFMIHYHIEAVDSSAKLRIVSMLRSDVVNFTDDADPRVASGHAKKLFVKEMMTSQDSGGILMHTKASNLEMAAYMGHDKKMVYGEADTTLSATYEDTILCNEVFEFTKFVVYTDSIRHSDCLHAGKGILERCIDKGSGRWFIAQKAYMDQFWKHAYVDVDDQNDTESSINYNIYQLLASAGKDPHSNICAKGLSGEGYEGHYFWDTEIYMLPLFYLTRPQIAKNLLKFRYTILEKAKARALEMGHKKGAKIPWRTISGSECSAFFPAGSAQYHINADVAYAYIQYYLLTNDTHMMMNFGFEVLVETGRIWLDMGHYHNGRYMIHRVTGPDEYSAVVDNNYYTNSMAAYHMAYIVKLYKILTNLYPDEFQELTNRIHLAYDEIVEFHKASHNMYLPYDNRLGTYLQDDGFADKQAWDFEGTPSAQYPLLLHYHPLTIYRYKVLKQADTLLSFLLLDNVSEGVIENGYHYYEPLTTHDSSLSPCVHGMIAARIRRPDLALEYLDKTIRLDLDNLHGNTKDGLHIANAGGAYMSIVYGFGGLRIKEDGIHLRPTLPSKWASYGFRFTYRGVFVKVTVSDMVYIEAESPIQVFVDGVLYEIQDKQSITYGE